MKKWILLMIGLTITTSAWAMTWQDLWFSKDQQGVSALAQGDAQRAAKLFTSPEWKASALYRTQQYHEAEKIFSQVDDHYNRGNALALAGDLDNAIKSYEKALEQDPQYEDAKYNLEIIKKLQQQRSSSKENNSDHKQNNENSKDNSSKKDQNKSEKEHKQPENKQDSDQSDQEQDQDKNQNEDKPDDQTKTPQNEPTPAPSQPQNNQDDMQPMPTDPRDNQAQNSSAQLEQQANEQWLKRIPDDPGGLLKQKFLRDHERYQNNNGLLNDE